MSKVVDGQARDAVGEAPSCCGSTWTTPPVQESDPELGQAQAMDQLLPDAPASDSEGQQPGPQLLLTHQLLRDQSL